MAEFTDIISTLPRLSAEQLEEVRKRISALQALSGKTAGKIEAAPIQAADEFDYLLEGVLEEIRARGLGPTIPGGFRIRKLKSFANYSEKSGRIKELLAKNLGPGIKRAEYRALGLILARSLARSLEVWTEISLDTMLRNIDKIPDALDQAFPGYLNSGLLHMLLKTQRKVDP